MKYLAIAIVATASIILAAQYGVNLEARLPNGLKICTTGEGLVKGHRFCVDVYLLPLPHIWFENLK